MDLYVCGRTAVLRTCQEMPCERRYREATSQCSHVSNGQVDRDTGDKICPLTPLKPTPVLNGQERIELSSFEASNIVSVSRDGQEIICEDQNNITEVFSQRIFNTIPFNNVQDLWLDPKLRKHPADMIDDDDDDLFADEQPPPRLGLLTQDGSIFSVDQGPVFKLTEHTNPSKHRKLLHAVIRRETNNYQGDTWPHIVFPEQPNTIYVVRTVSELIQWTQEDACVPYHAITLPSPAARLLCSPRGATTCLCLTSSGTVYAWPRARAVGKLSTTTLETALTTSRPPTTNDRNLRQLPNLPPVQHLSVGTKLGAALTTAGALYIFLLSPLSQTADGTHRVWEPHLAELDLGPPNWDSIAPFTPKLARIPGNGESAKFVDVAVGTSPFRDHVVAVTAEGQVWAVGEGMHGQLGIGERMFGLDAKRCMDGYEGMEFAEEWQEVDVDVGEGKKVVGVGAGYECSLFLVRSLD